MRRVASLAVALVVTLTTAQSTVLAEAPPPPPFRVIIHPSNPATSAERKWVADAFLKKTTTWGSGDIIRPVDQGPKSTVRIKFSEEILHRSVAEVKSYWQQKIFSGGDVPPPELDGDEEVVRYVLKYSGAIGYVSGSAKLNGTKVLAVK